MTLVLLPSKGSAWLGSQISFSSRAETLEAASAQPCVSPRREGHMSNPKPGSRAQPEQTGK